MESRPASSIIFRDSSSLIKDTDDEESKKKSSTVSESFFDSGELMKVQDDFFYKITQISDYEFKIEVPSTKKKYICAFDPKHELGFTGLPFEWERYLRDMKIRPDEI